MQESMCIQKSTKPLVRQRLQSSPYFLVIATLFFLGNQIIQPEIFPIQHGHQHQLFWQNSRVQIANHNPEGAYRILPKKHPPMSVGLCVIAIHSKRYLDEFLDYYYYVIGIDHIYLYDNSVDNELKGAFQNRSYLTTIHFLPNQSKAYQHCGWHYGKYHKWMAAFDVDEFLVIDGHIADFLERFDKDPSIGQVSMNWRTMGTANQTEYQPRPVSQRFRYAKENIDYHIKSIHRSEALFLFYASNAHYRPLKRGYRQVSSSGLPIDPQSPYNHRCEDSPAVIHHYLYKSVSEYAEKGVRGSFGIKHLKRNYTIMLKRGTNPGKIWNPTVWEKLKKHVPKYRLFERNATDSFTRIPPQLPKLGDF